MVLRSKEEDTDRVEQVSETRRQAQIGDHTHGVDNIPRGGG